MHRARSPTSRASRCPCDHAQLCHYIRACWGAGRWPYLELGRLRWTVFAPQRLVTVSSTSTSRASAGAPVNQDDSDRSHWRAPGHRPQERRGAVDMLTPLRGVTVLSKPHRSTPQRAALVPIFHASSVREAREASLDPHRKPVLDLCNVAADPRMRAAMRGKSLVTLPSALCPLPWHPSALTHRRPRQPRAASARARAV